MADYKELLRRAISALPENNGVARRAVYEKARSALVGQLRAISPPLPARDITQHRLQLEDCIRQVEQEASEAIISLGRDASLSPRFTPEPVPRPVITAPLPAAVVPPKPVEQAAPPVEELIKPAAPVSIEDIISEAAATAGTTVETVLTPLPPAPLFQPRTALRAVPIVPKAGPTSPLSSAPRSNQPPLKLPSFEPRQDALPLAASTIIEPARNFTRADPSIIRAPAATAPSATQLILPPTHPIEAALSSVREVEVETAQPGASEAEGVIASAIETLDREARGEITEAPPETAREAADRMFSAPKSAAWTPVETSSFTPPPEPNARSGGGMTIFLIVFAVLLAGVGGAGFWAWREGYIDVDQMFGQNQTTTETAAVSPITTPTLDPVATADPAAPVADGPGNTATTADTVPTTTLDGLQTDDRLAATPEAVVPTGTETTLPDIGATEEPKGEERLSGDDATVANVNDPAASVDPAVLAGSQSLLLEASADGRTGAVPFSGTIDWTEGADELGLPTIIGNASIPARNLSVQITIRKNSDPSLPASHLMEVDFNVNDTFIGGTIANLPGVLLKDAELVPGTPLVGASARVVGNSFLFALSASPNDVTTNTDLLENRRWMDLAVVYGTGRNAIITLEKDDAAQTMFDTVFTAWAQ